MALLNLIENITTSLDNNHYTHTTQIFFFQNVNADSQYNIASNKVDNLISLHAFNKLSLNVTKTKYIIFSNIKTMNNINCLKLEKEECIIYLGGCIDHNPSRKNCIAHISSKLSKSTFFIYKALCVSWHSFIYPLQCNFTTISYSLCASVGMSIKLK